MTEHKDTIEYGAEAAPKMTARALPVLSKSGREKVWELVHDNKVVAIVSCSTDNARFMSGEHTRDIAMAWEPYGSGQLSAYVNGFAPALSLVVNGRVDAFVVPRISLSKQVVFTVHRDEAEWDEDGEPMFGSSSGTFATIDEAKGYAESEATRERSRETMLDEYGIDWRGLLDD